MERWCLYPRAHRQRHLPRRVAVERRDHATSRRLPMVVAQLEAAPPEGLPNIGAFRIFKVLIENGRPRLPRLYILYREKRASGKRTDGTVCLPGTFPGRFWTLDWACSHNVHTVELLNEAIRHDRLHEIVTARAAYPDVVKTPRDPDRRDEVRMVLVAVILPAARPPRR